MGSLTQELAKYAQAQDMDPRQLKTLTRQLSSGFGGGDAQYQTSPAATGISNTMQWAKDNPIDAGTLAISPMWPVGDIAGVANDARHYLKDPKSRNWANYGMTALGALPFVPPVMGMAKAFHGGPHKWLPEEGFPQGHPRLDKMGTGEGAQAYGHGFYAAESPGVANQYRSALSGYNELVLTTGQGKKRGGALDDVDLEVSKYLEYGASDAGQFPHNTVHYAKRRAEAAGDQSALARLDEYGTDARTGYEKNLGTTYELDIPDDAAAKFLDWDAPLSEQGKAIQDIAKSYGIKTTPSGMKEANGSDLYRAISAAKRKPPFDSASLNAGGMEGSEALRKAGIPGLKYYDQMSRGGKEGTRNFVVWDQDVLDRTKILGQE